MLRPDLFRRWLLKDAADDRRDHRLRALRHAREEVAGEVRAAALPGRASEDGGDGILEALMGIRDDQLHTGQPTRDERPQEAEPKGAILARAAVQSEYFALPLTVDRGGDDDGDVDHAPALTHLLGERVEPDVHVRPLVQRPFTEGLHLHVERLTDTRDLALGDAVAAERLHEVFDPARGDTLDVGLLDDGEQRLFGAAARLQEGGQVGAFPQLGDAQVDRARAGVPAAWPAAVSIRDAVC